jgi:hypothetical protein
MAGYDDSHVAAATNALALRAHDTRIDPLDRNDTQAELPDHGLDEDETAGIELANVLDADALLPTSFGTWRGSTRSSRTSRSSRPRDCSGTTLERDITDPTKHDS